MAKNRGSDVLVAKLLQEANHLIEVLPGISRIPKELDVKYITQAHDGLETTAAGLKRANDARSQAVAQKVERVRALREAITRIRAAVKGIHGDDSAEYEMVGGKRRSTRKRPV